MVHPTSQETHQSHEIEVDTQLSLLEAVSLHSPARIAGLYIWVPPGYIKKLMKGITFTPFHPCFVLLSYPGQSWEDPQVVWSEKLQLRQKSHPPNRASGCKLHGDVSQALFSLCNLLPEQAGVGMREKCLDIFARNGRG